jgi:mono/diheme cytochrome c family protein
MMKKGLIIISIVATGITLVGCDKTRRSTGRSYMPDMVYSRAYETYASTDNLKQKGIFYDGTPVPGTIARGDMATFPYGLDKAGDTTNYVASKSVPNPLPSLDATQLKEAERLYLVNCAICHGAKLDGNGPLWNNGDGPYPAAPKNLLGDPVVSKMPDGQIFYAMTFGKGQMGSYASQLNTRERWMVVHYINSKRYGTKAAQDTMAGDPVSTTAVPDSTAKPK